MGLRRHRRNVLGLAHGPRIPERLDDQYGDDARLMKVDPVPLGRLLNDPPDITRA